MRLVLFCMGVLLLFGCLTEPAPEQPAPPPPREDTTAILKELELKRLAADSQNDLFQAKLKTLSYAVFSHSEEARNLLLPEAQATLENLDSAQQAYCRYAAEKNFTDDDFCPDRSSIQFCYSSTLQVMENITYFNEDKASILKAREALELTLPYEELDFVRSMQLQENIQTILESNEPLLSKCQQLASSIDALSQSCANADAPLKSLKNRLGCPKLQETNQYLENVQGQLAEQARLIYVYVEETPDFLEEDLPLPAIMQEAFQFWEEQENVRFIQLDSIEQADTFFSWVKEFGGSPLGHAYNQRFVEIGLGDADCFDQWQPYSENTLRLVGIHEIGHVLGYDHSDDPNSIMYEEQAAHHLYEVNTTITIPENYAFFYPTCTPTESDSISYSYQVRADGAVDVFIVPSRKDYENLLAGRSFNHYSACSEQDVRTYRQSCTIDREGGIVIQNFRDPVEVYVKVEET